MAENFTFNHDGSVDLTVEGEKVRFVKESDLLTVKGVSKEKEEAWETEKASFNTQLAEANRLREESHTLLLQERAAKEQLQQTYADHDTLKSRVGELETENGSLKESVSKYDEEVAGRIRHNLITYHGASEEAVKDKTLPQLRNLEEAARVFGDGKGKQVRPANYDGGAGGAAGGTTPETPRDRALRILDDHDRSRGRIPAGNVPAPKQ